MDKTLRVPESTDAGGRDLDYEQQTVNGKVVDVERMATPGIYAVRLAYTGTDLEYVGLADPGMATSAAAWQVRKLTYSAGLLVSIMYADGNRNFDNVWDNRAGLSYS